ncbi:hypothetical protein GW17_00008417 [Ensete ventricosum]|nr:hypothetical protein GW17_00008417 [Ensete ventricosum]
MEGHQDGEGQERIESANTEEYGAVISGDDGVVGDPHDAKDEKNHEGSESPQRGAELEHVPRHDHRHRSVHRPLALRPRRGERCLPSSLRLVFLLPSLSLDDPILGFHCKHVKGASGRDERRYHPKQDMI